MESSLSLMEFLSLSHGVPLSLPWSSPLSHGVPVSLPWSSRLSPVELSWRSFLSIDNIYRLEAIPEDASHTLVHNTSTSLQAKEEDFISALNEFACSKLWSTPYLTFLVITGHKLNECRLGGGSYWAHDDGTGKVHGLEAAPLFTQCRDGTWVALLPEDTVHGNEHIMGLDAAASPTTKVLHEVLLRLWVVHGMELNAKHTSLSISDNSPSANPHTLPHSEHTQSQHQFWFAGPMWEGQCRRGSVTNQSSNQSAMRPHDEQQPRSLQIESTPTPTSMEMAMSNCNAEQLVLLSNQSALLRRAAKLNDGTPDYPHSTKKGCSIFKTTHTKCDCTASLKIQRVVLFDRTNGVPAHLVTLKGVHTCTKDKALNAMRPKYPSVALNLAAKWATPWAMSGTDRGDVVAMLITERFSSLIETFKYQPHPRLCTCLSPSFRDITPVVVAAKKRAGEGRKSLQLQITDATIDKVAHAIETSTGDRVKVMTPKLLQSIPTLALQGHSPKVPLELELDERLDDTDDKVVKAAISANMAAELLSATVVGVEDDPDVTTRYTPHPCLTNTPQFIVPRVLIESHGHHTESTCCPFMESSNGVTLSLMEFTPLSGVLSLSPHGVHIVPLCIQHGAS